MNKFDTGKKRSREMTSVLELGPKSRACKNYIEL